MYLRKIGIKFISIGLAVIIILLSCSLGIEKTYAVAGDPFYIGNAIHYADTNDSLYRSAPLTTQTDNITMETWVKADTISAADTNIRIMYNGNSGTSGYGIYLAGANKYPSILMGSVAFIGMTTPETINTGIWYHLAAVRDNGVWKLYINGVEKALNSNTLAPNAIVPTDNFSIGNNSLVPESFNGCFDEVRFWTVARTAQQIRDNMYVKLDGAEAGLLAYYNFDQSGIVPGDDNTSITEVLDLAGGDQNLTVSGFTLDGATSNFIQSVQLGQFQFENASYSVGEQEGNVRVAITRTGGSEGSVAINYSTSDGTAVADTNYTATNGSVTFASGETRKEIDIPIINSGIAETKNFTISLSAQLGVQFGASSTTAISVNPSNATVIGTGFSYPFGVTTDSSDNIYVAISGSNTVKQMDSTGAVTNTWTGFNSPKGVAVDSSGNIYVSNYAGDTVVKMNGSGETVYTFTLPVCSYPTGVALDSSGNYLYVAYEGSGNITKMNSSNGAVDGTFSSPSFTAPAGVAIDSIGNIYVADTMNNTITKMNGNGAIYGIFISPLLPNQYPVGVAVDRNDNLYVSYQDYDATLGYVIKMNSNTGEIVDTYDGFVNPQCLAADSSGNLYVADANDGTVTKLTFSVADATAPTINSVDLSPTSATNGNVTVTVTAEDASGIADAGGYSFDGGTTWLDGDSKVYTANTTIAAGTIQVKDTAGNIAVYESPVVINNIDKTAPTISSVDLSPTIATNGAVTVTVAAADASGIATTGGYSFDGGTTWQDGNSKVYTSNTTIAAGTIKVKDTAGNIAVYESPVVINNIDKTAPTIGSVDLSPTIATNGAVTVTVTAADASGIAATGGYSFDGGTTWQDGNSKVYTENTAIAAGTIKVKDTLGNIAVYESPIVINNIDKTAPTINSVDLSPTIATNGDVTVTVTAADASGIAATGGYSFDGGTTWQDGNSKVYTSNTTIAAGTIKVKDTLGNIAVYESPVVINNIDKTAPTISSVDLSPTIATNGAVTVTVTAADASGIAATGGYSFDGGTTWQDGNSKVYTANTTIAAGTIKVKDTAGNVATYGTQIDITNIDTISPFLIMGAVSRTNITDGTVKFTSNEVGEYYYGIVADGDPEPPLNTTEAGIACSTVETTIYLTGLSDFAKDIYIKVKDAAGNISNVLKIDLDTYSYTTANALNNTVTVNSSSIFIGGSVVITATGDRQETITGSSYGDERFVPVTWTSNEAGKSGTFSLDADSYTSIYTPSASGIHTITAEFVKQQWNGSAWVDVENVSKTVNLNVSEPGDFSMTAAPGDSMVGLEWVPVTDAIYYDIYINNTFLHRVADGVYQYDITSLSNGTTYSFKVKALDIDETVISISDEVSAKPVCAPGAPANVKAIAGDRQATVSFTAPVNNGGSPITSYVVTSSPGGITATGTSTNITVEGLSNGTVYTFTVRAVNAVGEGQESSPSNEVTPHVPPQPTNTDNAGVEILVNGKSETAATSTTTTEENKTITTVIVDGKKVEEKLQNEGNNVVVTILVNNKSDVITGQLNGQTTKNMETKEAVLEIKADGVTYTLPASQINIDSVSEQIGKQVELKDIMVNVTISAPPQDTVKIVEDTANKNNYQVVVKPIEFSITCSSGNKTVDVSKFNNYVERTVAIPDGIDPSKITTGVVLNADGTFSHVPTTIVVIDGKYYAKINSLTNSTYSVIWNPKTFKDVEKHWAKDAVNDMGSRLVISGTGNNMFEPDRDITRGEFAAIVVRALGLMRPVTGNASFSDVSKNDWYYDAILIAYENGIISGYGNGKFGSNDKITREQAITIIARAMKITKLNADFKADEGEQLLAAYSDSVAASSWAMDSIASCIKTGVVSGRNGNFIAPKDNITRAEVAAIVQRLLYKSNLIN